MKKERERKCKTKGRERGTNAKESQKRAGIEACLGSDDHGVFSVGTLAVVMSAMKP